jgi:hypothetical protein
MNIVRERECDYAFERFLKRGFNSRDLSENKIIVERGRPICELPELKAQTKLCGRKFNLEQYSKTEWLSGCHNIGKLFCWPCLLFPNEKNVWNKTGPLLPLPKIVPHATGLYTMLDHCIGISLSSLVSCGNSETVATSQNEWKISSSCCT